MKYIAVVAGRSGGHIIPGITLAQQYQTKHADHRIMFFATNNALDKKIVDNHVIDKRIYLSVNNVPRKWYLLPIFMVQMAYATLKSFAYLLCFRPTKLVVMGGYISLPVCIAALLLRIPRELYELNAIPGKATRILAPIANTIHVCFKESLTFFPKKKTTVCEYPIRFAPSAKSLSKEDACAIIGLHAHLPTLLVLGGSQGSASLNKIIQQCFIEYPMLKNQVQIIHQTGDRNEEYWQTWYKNNNIKAHSFAFNHDLSRCYAAADMVIGRAGAGTIFEIKFFAKPCILVPLEIPGNDHQLHNANAFAKEYQSASVVRQRTGVVNNIFKNVIENNALCGQHKIFCSPKSS